MSLKSSLVKELSKGPKTVKQLKNTGGADRKKVAKALEDLAGEGKVRAERGVYSLVATPGSLVGAAPLKAVIVKLGRSFAFASALDDSGDIFIPGHSLHGAMPGDEVEVSLLAYPRVEGSREGEVDAILTPQDRVVGTVQKRDGKLVLVPDNAKDTPLAIRKSADGGAREGEKAAGVIIERGNRHDDHKVGIVLRFGSADSARQCAKAILYGLGVEKAFPGAVKDAAKAVSEEKITKEEIRARKDLRKDVIFTIDDASTKDIDDAISARRILDGYRLSVHIADVSHYVGAKTALDEEALKRGTSIYYADSVIPMLPRALSNGICSLNPDEDRLAFSCILTLDSQARMLDYRFFKTVIKSKVKGVYAEINQIFEGTADAETEEKYGEVRESLEVMEEIYHKLAVQRSVRGCMEIESDEPKLTINEEGRCVDVRRRARGEAERMIEEFMLMANTAAAHLARRLDIPFVYRVHDKPAQDRFENLKNLLVAAGLDFRFAGDEPTQKEFSKLLNETRGTNLEKPVHTGVLRTMAKAKYEPVPKGHYGLALEDYAHFTSPIRRYPDLAIHRILSDVAAGMPEAQLRKKYKNFAEQASALSSERELVAQRVERDCDDCYKAEYMQQFIGEEFEGVVSSVTRFGIYIELASSIEGLIHITNLATGKMDLVEGVSLTDARTGQGYRLGDAIRVKVAGVDISQGNVDFVLADA